MAPPDRFGYKGICYLIHFNEPFAHARHYLGWASYDRLEARLVEHAKGQGSRLIRHVNEAGISWVVSRVWWDVDRYQERRMKNRGHSRRCWICTPPVRRDAATVELMNRWMGYEVPSLVVSAAVVPAERELRVPVQAAG